MTDQDYDLLLFAWNGSSWVPVASSQNVQSGTQQPTEKIATYITPVTTYYGIAVGKYSSTRNVMPSHINAYNVPDFYLRVPQRSLVDDAGCAAGPSTAATR